ncbi:MAG: hypothetical protein QJR14_00245 [Bacillota bacterium]|nr:hypothetical protein [Bacillota bacterium]
MAGTEDRAGGRRLAPAQVAAIAAALAASEEEGGRAGARIRVRPAAGSAPGVDGFSPWRWAGRMDGMRGAERLMLMRGGRKA